MNSIDPLIALDTPQQAGSGPGDVRRRALRFGAGCLIFALLVAAWLWGRRHLPLPALGVVLLGSGVLGVAVVKPAAALALRAFWLKIARYIGTFNTFVLLCVIYFVAVVPIGLIARLLGRDRLGLRRRNAAASYWHTRDQQRDPKHFERPY
jgi:hypothetical protein